LRGPVGPFSPPPRPYLPGIGRGGCRFASPAWQTVASPRFLSGCAGLSDASVVVCVPPV